jgi:hypothetical protein
MPDRGVSIGEPINTAEHVATPEWQSFEQRMRHRRAERCIQHAGEAIESGRLGEAKDALEEVRGLDPSHEGLQNLLDRLTALEAPPPPPPSFSSPVAIRTPSAWPAVAVACAAIAMSGFAGWFGWTQWMETPRSETAADIRLPLEVDPSAVPVAPVAPSQADVSPSTVDEPSVATTGADEPAESRVSLTSPSPLPLAPAAPEGMARSQRETIRPPQAAVATVPPSATPRIAIDEPPAVLPRVAPRPAADAPAAAPPPVELAPPVSASPPPAPPVVEETRAMPEPVRKSEPVVSEPVVDERLAVRAALSRYESAYSQLDAAGAAAVWPAVDRRALARAFEGLESQRVTLGNCDVGVKGQTARASCAGRATWTPKIGGGAESRARTWIFDLRRADRGWQIVSVAAR